MLSEDKGLAEWWDFTEDSLLQGLLLRRALTFFLFLLRHWLFTGVFERSYMYIKGKMSRNKRYRSTFLRATECLPISLYCSETNTLQLSRQFSNCRTGGVLESIFPRWPVVSSSAGLLFLRVPLRSQQKRPKTGCEKAWSDPIFQPLHAGKFQRRCLENVCHSETLGQLRKGLPERDRAVPSIELSYFQGRHMPHAIE